MKRVLALVAALAVLASSVTPALAQAQGTLEKINQSGTLTIGTRTGSPPFAYVNSKNEWVGFAVDLVEELVKPALEKKDELKQRIEEASKYVPMERLALSSQCGFASTEEGNLLTEEEQVAKLRLVADTAKEVWS